MKSTQNYYLVDIMVLFLFGPSILVHQSYGYLATHVKIHIVLNFLFLNSEGNIKIDMFNIIQCPDLQFIIYTISYYISIWDLKWIRL